MKFRRRNFNYKLMLSYFALVCLIVGLISISSYLTFLKMYRQSVDELNQKTLQTTVELYEEKIFRPMTKIYTDFLGTSGMGNLFYGKEQLDTMEIYGLHNHLRSEVIKNECISEIHIYSADRQQMISSRFGYESGEDLEKILDNYLVDFETLGQADFPVITPPFQYSQTDTSWYYLVIYSTNIGKRQENNNYILFTMDVDKISEIINQSEDDQVYIVAQNGVVLCHSQPDVVGNEVEFGFDPNSAYTVLMDGNTVISCMKSTVNDQFFVVETFLNGFYPAVRQLIVRMVLITVLMIFAGGVAAIAMSKHMAKPIQQVVHMISDTLPEGVDEQKQDLEGIVNTICDEFQSLERFTKSSKETIKNNYILNLYWNQTHNLRELDGKKTYIGFSGHRKYLPVLISCSFQQQAAVERQVNEEARQMAIYKYIYDLENQIHEFSVIAGETEENVIAVICGGENCQKMISFLQGKGRDEGMSRVFVGELCSDDWQIGESFAMLRAMMPYQFFNPQKFIWYVREFRIENEKDFEVNMSEFLRNLKSYQLDACIEVFDACVDQMEKQAISYEKRQEVLLKYISAVSDMARMAGIHLEKMTDIIDSKNILMFRENFEKLMEEFKQASISRQQSRKQGEAESIRRFIADHYDQDISLNMIAENMHMSVSYISRFFKEQTGQNITEYIKETKLMEAEKLLITTDYSVEKIAGMIGYNTTHYFIKQFKERYGDTPTVYRKHHYEN